MSRQAITTVVVFGVTGALVAYDFWAALVPGATISEVMLALGHRHPIIPLGIGILLGHFYWSQAAEAEWQAKVLGASRFPVAEAARRVGGWPPPRRRPYLLWAGLAALLAGLTLVLLGR